MSTKQTCEPFRFLTSSSLVEITGKKAYHLKDFVQILKKIDSASIFYHVHHAFREYSFAAGEFSNDFARWVAEDLEEKTLAERFSAINIRDYVDLESLRQKLIEIVESHLSEATEIRKAAPGREFYFLRNIAIILPTPYEVYNIEEFIVALDKVGMRSLYYHFFDARLRLGHKTNDFSNWINKCLNEPEIAKKIESLDPYFMSMDQLKESIIAICSGADHKVKSQPDRLVALIRQVKKLIGRK